MHAYSKEYYYKFIYIERVKNEFELDLDSLAKQGLRGCIGESRQKQAGVVAERGEGCGREERGGGEASLPEAGGRYQPY